MAEPIPPNAAAIRSAKAALRREILQARKTGAGDRTAAAEAIAVRVSLLLGQQPQNRIVSGFLPIGDEIDPRPALEMARGKGCRICLPVMAGRDAPLVFKSWAPGESLDERQWGIREPGEAAEVLEPDVLVMPLLAFDETGGRLGYGGGYYDRTLAGLRSRKSIVAVGIAYDVQRVDLVPRLDYDERLDWVLTPTRSIKCRALA